MQLKEIKNQVSKFFPGKCQQWINGKVKEMTSNGDLRKKSTWDYALNLLRANEIETIPSIGVEPEQRVTFTQIGVAIAMLDSLSNKEVVTPQQFVSAVVELESLPLREIAPNVFLVGAVEPARPLVA